MITLKINGDDRSFSNDLTVSELIHELKIKQEAIAVEVNKEIVPRGLHAEHALKDGDEIEIVTFVGGG